MRTLRTPLSGANFEPKQYEERNPNPTWFPRSEGLFVLCVGFVFTFCLVLCCFVLLCFFFVRLLVCRRKIWRSSHGTFSSEQCLGMRTRGVQVLTLNPKPEKTRTFPVLWGLFREGVQGGYVTQGSLILPTTSYGSLSFPIRFPRYLPPLNPPSLKNPISVFGLGLSRYILLIQVICLVGLAMVYLAVAHREAEQGQPRLGRKRRLCQFALFAAPSAIHQRIKPSTSETPRSTNIIPPACTALNGS